MMFYPLNASSAHGERESADSCAAARELCERQARASLNAIARRSASQQSLRQRALGTIRAARRVNIVRASGNAVVNVVLLIDNK